MITRPTRRRQPGLTIIELMFVLVVAGVLVAIAIPGFGNLLARTRLEGVMAELQTDLQFARSEAVARNLAVQVTFGPGCYVIHTVGTTATSCTQAAASTIGAGAVEIKTTQLQAGSAATFVPQPIATPLTNIVFDPVRGTAVWDGGDPEGSVIVSSSAGPWQLRASIGFNGRVQQCSPGGSTQGYATC